MLAIPSRQNVSGRERHRGLETPRHGARPRYPSVHSSYAAPRPPDHRSECPEHRFAAIALDRHCHECTYVMPLRLGRSRTDAANDRTVRLQLADAVLHGAAGRVATARCATVARALARRARSAADQCRQATPAAISPVQAAILLQRPRKSSTFLAIYWQRAAGEWPLTPNMVLREAPMIDYLGPNRGPQTDPANSVSPT
mgnify:CR=1 FL=1